MENNRSNKISERVDEKTLYNVIRQYVGKKSVGTSSIKKKKIMKKPAKNLKLIISPILQKPLFENKMFFLYGGLMLPCDFSIEGGEVISERMSFQQSCQRITKIEKRNYQLIINYTCPYLGLKNFQFLIDIYNNKGKESYKNLATSLENIQNNIVTWNQAAEEQQKSRYIDAEKYMKRVEQFSQIVLQKVDELDQSKFYLFGTYIYDYEKKQLEQRSIGYSQGFLSLLGTDADQFSQINLRCGEPQSGIGEYIIESLIQSLLPLSSKILQSGKIEVDITLVTLDGFCVPCKEIRQQYMSQQSMNLGFIEMAFEIVEYDVSLNGLKQLLSLRAKNNNQKVYNQFDFFTGEDFEYSMNSVTFLEKYYPKAITKEYLICKYRNINQLQPSLYPSAPIEFNEQIGNSNMDSSSSIDKFNRKFLGEECFEPLNSKTDIY